MVMGGRLEEGEAPEPIDAAYRCAVGALRSAEAHSDGSNPGALPPPDSIRAVLSA
jgi:hypothetical protein